MHVKNVSSETREIAVGDFLVSVEPGETVEVPDEVANGRPASGTRGADGELDRTRPDFDAGTTGLLDQPWWEKARKAKDETPTGEEA